MQAYKSDDENFKNAMKESQSKIHAMALVHEFLYLGENLAYINVNEYTEKLLEDLKELYISQNTQIQIDLNLDVIEFSINRCIQVGMILHELCVNALKYAFKENRNNILSVHMKLINEEVHLKIKDNGDGFKEINAFEKSDSIGMQLVHSISNTIKLKYGYLFDKEKEILYYKDDVIKLTNKETDIIKALCKSPGQKISQNQLEYIIWQNEPAGYAAFRSVLFRLRNKVHKDLITNQNNTGYRIELL